MTVNIKASDVLDLAYDLGDLVRSISPRYSGRGMYGANCLGFTTDDPNGLSFRLGQICAERDGYSDDPDWPTVAHFLGRATTDNMGRSTIIYWPGLQVEGTDDELEQLDDFREDSYR